MSKMVRLDEDVYFVSKAKASKEGKTLSAAVYALMHTADQDTRVKDRLTNLEFEISE